MTDHSMGNNSEALQALKNVMALLGEYPDKVPSELGMSAWRSVRSTAFDVIARAEGRSKFLNSTEHPAETYTYVSFIGAPHA